MKINVDQLTDEERIYHQRIETFLSQSSEYLKTSFKLYHLYSIIDCGPTKTSKLINKIYGVKYCELINRYRINYFDKEIRRRLEDDEKFIITNLIKQSGFDTRSLFYLKFKELKGMSPKEYYRL